MRDKISIEWMWIRCINIEFMYLSCFDNLDAFIIVRVSGEMLNISIDIESTERANFMQSAVAVTVAAVNCSCR